MAAVGIVAGCATLITALVDPNKVGLEVIVCDPCIKIAIAIKVFKDDVLAAGVTQHLATVGKGSGSSTLDTALVEPHAVGLTVVGYPCIEITIAIDIPEGDTGAPGVAESLATVGEVAKSVVDPHVIGFIAVCDPCIEIAIAIEIADVDSETVMVAESLATVGKGSGSSTLVTALVEPHAVGLGAAVCHPCIEIAIVIEVAEGNIFTGEVTESLAAIDEAMPTAGARLGRG